MHLQSDVSPTLSDLPEGRARPHFRIFEYALASAPAQRVFAYVCVIAPTADAAFDAAVHALMNMGAISIIEAPGNHEAVSGSNALLPFESDLLERASGQSAKRSRGFLMSMLIRPSLAVNKLPIVRGTSPYPPCRTARCPANCGL